MRKYFLPDLVIFALITNDIFIDNSNKDMAYIKQCLKSDKNIRSVYESDTEETITPKKASQILNEAWSNPINQCILSNTLINLPTDNVIYFLTQDEMNDSNQARSYKKYLVKYNKFVLTFNLGKNIPKYTKYWNDDLWNNFTISSIDGHSNSLANQMYTDIIFNEITSNLLWNFY